MTKGELTEAVWPNTAVMDNSLAQCLVEIRRALGDEQRPTAAVARCGALGNSSARSSFSGGARLV